MEAEPSLISAYWPAPNDLDVSLDIDDRTLALTACTDLIDIVKERSSLGPDGTVYTYTSDDVSLFIWDRSSDLSGNKF